MKYKTKMISIMIFLILLCFIHPIASVGWVVGIVTGIEMQKKLKK